MIREEKEEGDRNALISLTIDLKWFEYNEISASDASLGYSGLTWNTAESTASTKINRSMIYLISGSTINIIVIQQSLNEFKLCLHQKTIFKNIENEGRAK